MKLNLKTLAEKQPLSAFLALASFLAPVIPIGFLLGIDGVMGALLLLGSYFLVGEVELKWIPWKQRFSKENLTKLPYVKMDEGA